MCTDNAGRSLEQYTVKEVAPEDFAFDLPVNPVQLFTSDRERAIMEQDDWDSLIDGGYIEAGSRQCTITHDYVHFMRNWRSGDSVDSMHSRDDALLRVRGFLSAVCPSCDLELDRQRRLSIPMHILSVASALTGHGIF